MADVPVAPFKMGNNTKNVERTRHCVPLLTKSKSYQHKIMDYAKKQMVVSDDDVDEFCRNELLTSTPVQRNQPSTSTLVQPSVNPEQPSQQSVSYLSEGKLSEVSLPSKPPIDQVFGGTTCIRNRKSIALQESIEADRNKVKEGSDEINEIVNNIMENRRAVVKPEPCLTEPNIVIRVRHPTKGIITRLFDEKCTMMDVYFWAGFISAEPLFFQLVDCSNNVSSYPEDDIKQGVYNMCERSENINMSRDGEVEFLSFAIFAGLPSIKNVAEPSIENAAQPSITNPPQLDPGPFKIAAELAKHMELQVVRTIRKDFSRILQMVTKA